MSFEYDKKFEATLSADEQTILDDQYEDWKNFRLDDPRDTGEWMEFVFHRLHYRIADDEWWEQIADDENNIKEFDAERLSMIPVWRKLLGEYRRQLDVLEAEVDAWEAVQLNHSGGLKKYF